jgi:hypothetical protein
MNACRCGCGNRPAGGDYLPGHDQKLRARLESEVGGLLALRDLVEAAQSYADGSMPLEVLGARLRDVVRAARARHG